DPMETALHKVYAGSTAENQRPSFRMVHEYPLSGKPPMMTHVFADGKGTRIIAAKGAPEAILACSALDEGQRREVLKQVEALGAQGYRVLGVGETTMEGDVWPAEQQ